jgi:hypothetical protein
VTTPQNICGETFTCGEGDEMWLAPLTLSPEYYTCFRIILRDDFYKNDHQKQGRFETMQTSKVFFDVVMSLDGFIAPDGVDMARANNPSGQSRYYKIDISLWLCYSYNDKLTHLLL